MRRTRLRAFVGKFVLTVMSVGAVLALLEGALRAIDFRPALSSEWVLTNDHRVADDKIITIDRRYLAAETYAPFRGALSANVIVALGDSFTAGVPVAQADSYPSVLERTLQSQSFDVRVFNAGLGDSGPDQQLNLFINYVLPRVRPAIVIWQFYPNDSLDNALKALYSISSTNTLVPLEARNNWMYRRQQFYDGAPLPPAIKQESYLFNLLLRRYEHGRSAPVPKGWDSTDWGREKIPLEIAHMNRLAEQHGFTLFIALVAPQSIYQSVEQNSPAYFEAREYPRLLAILKREPHFIHVRFDPEHGNPSGIFAEDGRDLNPPGTHHFNESGYARMAETIAHALREQSFTRVVHEPPVHLVFGEGTSRRWMRSGWYQDESAGNETYVWSEGARSVLELPLPTGSDIRMTLDCRAFRIPSSVQQSISVVLNGNAIQTINVEAERQAYQVILPRIAIRESLNTLEFRYAYARSPKHVQPGSQDTRTLAVVWFGVDFEPARSGRN